MPVDDRQVTRAPAHRHSRPRVRLAPFMVAPLLAAVATFGSDVSAPAGAAWAAGPAPGSVAAAGWLAAELARNGGAMPSFTPGSPDIGLTEDVVLALTAAGLGEGAPARSASAAVAAHLAGFVSYDSLGPRFAGVRLAGPLAKSLLVAEVQGANPRAFGGWDVEVSLRGLMATSGPQTGRFVDTNPYAADSSNGFGQAYALLALQRTPGGVPGQATGYLLAQQCPAGGFRLFYDSAASCTSDSQADTDATGLAVQALAAVPASPTVLAAQAKAVRWLVAAQDPVTGSFSGSGPTAAANSNTTGVVTPALRAAGTPAATAAAGKAAGYVESLQLGSGPDAGALGYDRAAFAAVTAGSIAAQARDQWRRASAQAVFALGLPGLGLIRAVPAAGGGSGGGPGGGTSLARLSASSVAPGGSLRVTASGFRPGERVQVWWHSSPVLLVTTVASRGGGAAQVVRVPASAPAGVHHLVLVGAASGHVASAAVTVTAAQGGAPRPSTVAGATLPATGPGGTGMAALAGVVLLLAGAALMVVARRGRRAGNTTAVASSAVAMTVLAMTVLGTTLLAPLPQAQAQVSTGSPGYCPGTSGVTVVVDFQGLGGGVVVRCFGAATSSTTGWQALLGAGFTIRDVALYPKAFVCQIQGEPTGAACISTPAPDYYWSYWYAPDGGPWRYSDQGVSSHQVLVGGFEGWSFADHKAATAIPPPRVAPTRPVPSPSPHPTTTSHPTTSPHPPAAGQHSSTPRASTSAATVVRPGAASPVPAPTGSTRQAGASPGVAVAAGGPSAGGSAGPAVSYQLPQTAAGGGAAVPTAVAVAAIAALLGAAAVVARRRGTADSGGADRAHRPDG